MPEKNNLPMHTSHMLSVVLAVKNEETNIGACLDAVRGIAGEVIVFDEYSTDKTRLIAREKGAKVFKYKHQRNFHETKQAAIEKASGDWILLLDADEIVTPDLAHEISQVVATPNWKRKSYKITDPKKERLFKRHKNAVEARDGKTGSDEGAVSAFFIARLNMFLGKPLRYAGVYPDGVIRLFRNGYAFLPAKDVHEQVKVKRGRVSWLNNELEHHDTPTLRRYLDRANRYTTETAKRFDREDKPRNFRMILFYTIPKPLWEFFIRFIRRKGFLDGMRGFIWAAFSAMHYPLAYYKYYIWGYNKKHGNQK